MFRTCQGHTEGEIVVTYVVVTSHYLYLLRPSNLPNKFIRDAAITYKELDYISVFCYSITTCYVPCHGITTCFLQTFILNRSHWYEKMTSVNFSKKVSHFCGQVVFLAFYCFFKVRFLGFGCFSCLEFGMSLMFDIFNIFLLEWYQSPFYFSTQLLFIPDNIGLQIGATEK